MNTKLKNPPTVITNQRVAVGKDLVFGWVVLTDMGWQPIDKNLGEDVLKMIDREIADAIFPAEVKNHMADLIIRLENEAEAQAQLFLPHVRIIVRDLNANVITAIGNEVLKHKVHAWDVGVGDIFSAAPVDYLISPANCTGRMDGGIDQVYIDRFGWQMEFRLQRDIKKLYKGHLAVGYAYIITTYDDKVPLLICAPTMPWPPQDVSQTQNAYLAMRAALRAVLTFSNQAHIKNPTVLVPGLCALTGKMAPEVCAEQMVRAYLEVCREAPKAQEEIKKILCSWCPEPEYCQKHRAHCDGG